MLKLCLLLLICCSPFLPWQISLPLLALASLLLLNRIEKLEKIINLQRKIEKHKESWTQVSVQDAKPAAESPPPAYSTGTSAETMAREPASWLEVELLGKQEIPSAPMETAKTQKVEEEIAAPWVKKEVSGEKAASSGPAPEPPKEEIPYAPPFQERPPEETAFGSSHEKAPYTPQPSLSNIFMEKAWDWLKNGNPVVKVGLVVLLFGVTFLLKYAVERDWFPPELRVALAGLLGIILLGIGWRLRDKNRTFALLLQGGGIATLYLTTFAAAKPDTFPLGLNMISAEWGLVIMTAIVIFSAILAVLQNALWVAIFGWAGGFMAPILLSTGSNRYIELFSYYTLLNAGLLGVAWFKNWRYLNMLGFFFTFGVGSIWGIQYYKPEFFSTTEPFLIIFFVMYATISILFAKSGAKGKEEARLDSVLVFGLPLIAFGLQMALVHDMEMGGAYSCLVLSAWYLGTAKFLWKKEKAMGILAESHIALGIIFLSLAVPMAFDATATASTWALEGAGIVWLGLRQKRLLSRIFGVLLQIGAAISFFIVLEDNYGNILETGQLLAGLFLAIGGFVSSWAYWNWKEDLVEKERFMDLACGILGFIFWYACWADWASELEISEMNLIILSVFTLSHLAWFGIGKKTSWLIPRYALKGFLALLFIIAVSWPEHPAANYGWIIWPLALILHFTVLRLQEEKWDARIVEFLHTGSALLLSFLFMWEAWWITDFYVPTGIWAYTAPAVMGGLMLFFISSQPRFLSWPLKVHERAYMLSGAVLAILLAAWWMLACFRADGQEPLPYVPVLNVLDLGQALIIALVAAWTLKAEKRKLFNIHELRRFFTASLAAAIFIWLNVVVTRIAHFWGGVPYEAYALFKSAGLQATYSVLWTFMAFVAMVYSHRRMRRELWFVGAGLLALVVAKLFLVDLSGRGTIAGIVSFLGVGILMLIVGYLCPLPPRQEEIAEPQTP